MKRVKICDDPNEIGHRWIHPESGGSPLQLRRTPDSSQRTAFEKIIDFPLKLLWEEELKPYLDMIGSIESYYIAVLVLLVLDVPGVGDDERIMAATALIESGDLPLWIIQDIVRYAPECLARDEAQRRLKEHQYDSSIIPSKVAEKESIRRNMRQEQRLM